MFNIKNEKCLVYEVIHLKIIIITSLYVNINNKCFLKSNYFSTPVIVKTVTLFYILKNL